MKSYDKQIYLIFIVKYFEDNCYAHFLIRINENEKRPEGTFFWNVNFWKFFIKDLWSKSLKESS